jgi:pyridoxamine 5'-phosphate oxidase-like protein
VAKLFDEIDEKLATWIRRQRLFFVGTAPSGSGGHVNVSPKGPMESLALVDGRTVAYLDVIGSGVETIAHLRENGRIVLMLCAFEGPPRIVRLHGRGEVFEPGDDAFAGLAARCGFEAGANARAIVRVDVERIADSCGYGVPLMDYVGERPQQAAWVERKLAQSPTALEEYKHEKNAASIDGLPGLGPRAETETVLQA